MRHWSRNDRFAFFGVILAAIGVVGAVFPQEIRHTLGLDNGTPAAQSNTVATSVPQANIPAPPSPVPEAPAAKPPPANELVINSRGDDATITILAAKTPVEESASPVDQSGDNLQNTYYLGKGKRAVVNLIGDDNTLILAPEVQSRVQHTTVGDDTKVRTLGQE